MLSNQLKLRRPSPAMAVALLALFVALGGTGVAATQLGRDSVGARQLKTGAVTTAKLRKSSVTGAKVANGSLTGADIDVARLGTVPSAASADRVGGHAVGCASGTVAAVAACVEPATRAPQPMAAAIATCASVGGRLPTLTELMGLRALGYQLADPELTGQAGGGASVSQLSLFADGTTLVQEDPGIARRFRCVTSPVR
jgi:hypothetical protein